VRRKWLKSARVIVQPAFRGGKVDGEPLAFEDLVFYAPNNIRSVLCRKFLELYTHREGINRIAFGIDLRERASFFRELPR